MPDKVATRIEAARLLAFFEGNGALRAETDILQPAATLLDLYGEDIRARAFTTHDPVMGEAMLRPDFTVPVVQMHMENGAEPARYTYAGKVFRAQEEAVHRAAEYYQVGYELFDGADAARADAEAFSLFYEVLTPHNLQVATGDLGILLAAVRGLKTTDARKAALMRHIWRPRRFRALLDRFSGRVPMPQGREKLLADGGTETDAPLIGLRSQAEIDGRIDALREDAAARPISTQEVNLLDDVLSLRETATNVLAHLSDFAVDMPAISKAVERLEARCEALAARGIDVENLAFEGSYGRTTLEYYDGFVFGFYAEARPDLPPVATGGRYDALTKVLGKGRSIPAIGGVVRPELVLAVSLGGGA
ncbi:MAG: ATP phosphoribosyltransferase regulatory subunit [Rhodobacteraceae bacterium]|nr:ATP phosphoribosyltransferase regulatory subunit [Paracoccaceae bacterium]